MVTGFEVRVGLEGVELFMEAEDEFGIRIPDADAQGVRTVGDFYDLVLRRVKDDGPTHLRQQPELEAYLWGRVAALSARHGDNVRPEEISRETRFVEDLGYG